MLRRHILPLLLITATPAAHAAEPVAVLITLQIRPGREAEFLDLLTPVLDAMRAEPSFITASLHRDPADASRFLLHEVWADRTELIEVQVKRPYRDAFWARLPDLLAAPREVREWRPMRTDAGALR
jgi:quinol monooxygenase YgiN